MSEGISLRAAGHVWARSVDLYRRTWLMNLLPNFFEPVIYLLGMGMGLGAYVGEAVQGMAYVQYLAPGLVVSNAMNGGAFETTYNLFIKVNFNRTYEAIMATPVSVGDAMLGELLWATTRGLVYGTVFAVVAAGFHLVSPLGFLLLLPVSLCTAWMFSAIGMVFTSYIRVIDMYSFFYTLFLTPMFLFSGIFFPLDRLPGWAQGLAWWTPLYHAVRLGRAAVLGPRGWAQAVDLAWVVGVALVASAWGMRRLQRALVR